MSFRSTSRRARALFAVGLLTAIAALLIPANLAFGSGRSGHKPKPTIVLVHGAWADWSSWAQVTDGLQRKGYTVLAAPNPLRGPSADAAYLAAFLAERTTGPVVLVGHSYGGAVITNAAVADPDVKALVYINAFAPDTGESLLSLLSSAGPVDTSIFDAVHYPGAPAGDVDLYIKTAVFPAAFANDLPARTAAQLAAAQRPITQSALVEPSGTPAWKTLPSWYLVGSQDHIIPPTLQQTMAQRAKSRTTRVTASHLSIVSKPYAVESLILSAARAVS